MGAEEMSVTSTDKEWRENAEQTEPASSHPIEAPVHPLPQLQGPFEESIAESADGASSFWQVFIDAQSRRDQILSSPSYERLCGRRWRQRPNERYHPLWKIVAQITFGLHLLAKNMAKSEVDVIKILQTHVSDIDGFIERTTDDLLLARNDIAERFELLRLPLENLQIFSEMLEDPTFRQTVIIDNERIEHIITRSTAAMDDSLKDIKKGIESVNGLAFYIKEVGKEWVDRPPDLDPVCEAMIGNVDGWNREFRRLKRNAYKLALVLTQMTRISLEIQRLVGVASRKGVGVVPRNPIPHKQSRLKFRKSNLRYGSPTILEKPLPRFPKISDPPPESRPASILTNTDHDQPVFELPASPISSPLQEETAAPNRSEDQQDHTIEDGQDTENAIPKGASNPPVAFKMPLKPVQTAALLKNDNSQDAGEEGDNIEHTTSSSKPPFKPPAPRRNSIKPSPMMRIRPGRLYRSASKTFSAISNVRNAIKGDAQAKAGPSKSPPNLSERSWIDFGSFDNQMSWAHELDGTNSFEPRNDVSPEFPHLVFLTISDDELSSEEEDIEDITTDVETNSDEGSHVTALPSLGSVSGNYDGPSSWYDDTVAEVASLYSVRSRKRSKGNSHKPPPLPTHKINAFTKFDHHDGGGDQTINQNRSWLGQKPFFSLRQQQGSSDDGSKSPSVGPGTFRTQIDWVPSGKSTGSLSLFPSIRSSSTRLAQSPPISPRTPYNPMSLAQSTRPGTTDVKNGVSSGGFIYLSAPTSPSFLTTSFCERPGNTGGGSGSDEQQHTFVKEAGKPSRRRPAAMLKPKLKKFASATSLRRGLQNTSIVQYKGRTRSNPMVPDEHVESKGQ